MAAPSVSIDLTPIAKGINGGNTAALPPAYPGVASSDLGVNFASASRFLGRSAARFRPNSSFSSAVYEGGGWDESPALDGTSGVFFFHLQAFDRNPIETIANNGIVIAFRSAASDWRRFVVGGSDLDISNYPHPTDNDYFPVAIDATLAGDFADDGAFNPAAINRIELHIYRSTSDFYTVNVAESFFVRKAAIAGGEPVNPSKLNTLAEEFNFNGASPSYGSLALIPLGNSLFYSYIPIAIESDYFEDNFALEFPPAQLPTIRLTPNSIGIAATPPSGSTLRWNRSKVSSPSSPYYFSCDLSNASLDDVSNLFVSGAGGTTLTDYSQLGGVFFGRDAFSLAGGSYTGVAFEACGTVTISGSESLQNCSIRNTQSSPGVIFTGNSGDYSGLEIEFQGDLTFRLDGASGTYDFTGFSQANGTLTFDTGAANTYTVIVPAGVTVATSATGGGSVTIQTPQALTAIGGFPSANNPNGVDPSPVLGIYDGSIGATPAGFIAALTTVDAEYSVGVYTINPADYLPALASGTTLLIVGDAVGWRRTTAIAINAASPPATLDISPAFEEYLDEAGNAFVGASAACTGLTYDQANTRFELASASGGVSNAYDFAGVAYRQELLTTNAAGLQSFDTAAIRAIQYISNDSYRRIILPHSLSVAASATATTSPIISDFVLLRADDSDPFEHGLDSDAPGLSDRPEVVIRFQAPSSSSGNPPTAVEIRQEIDGNSTQLAAILEDTGTTLPMAIAAIPVNPLLSTDGRLNVLDVPISSRLAAANYIAPDNTGISSANSKLDAIPTADNSAAIASIAAHTELLYQLAGLDATNPVSVSDSQISFASLTITITDDGATTTKARQ